MAAWPVLRPAFARPPMAVRRVVTTPNAKAHASPTPTSPLERAPKARAIDSCTSWAAKTTYAGVARAAHCAWSEPRSLPAVGPQRPSALRSVESVAERNAERSFLATLHHELRFFPSGSPHGIGVIVRDAVALERDAEPIPIAQTIVVLVVVHDHGVRAGRHVFEHATR